MSKGTHRARARFRSFVNVASKNYTKPCSVLKFDIKKCFHSIDQATLKKLLVVHVGDKKLKTLIEKIIDSFKTGLPLGNLTSQLFINIYLHELDHYVKQTLKVKYYLRYADDVVILHTSKTYLEKLFLFIDHFVSGTLVLTTHKMEVLSLYGGVDVLGEVFFGEYTRLRRTTERRMKRVVCT